MGSSLTQDETVQGEETTTADHVQLSGPAHSLSLLKPEGEVLTRTRCPRYITDNPPALLLKSAFPHTLQHLQRPYAAELGSRARGDQERDSGGTVGLVTLLSFLP